MPTQEITWLGRLISSNLGHISNSVESAVLVLHQLANFHLVHLHPYKLRRLLGSLQWMSNPASLNSPNLASAYHLLHKRSHPKVLPLSITYSLIYAVITTLLPARPRPLPPPLTMTPIFVDAAPQPQHYLSPPTTLFKVASIKPHSYATAATAPTWIKDQGFIRGIIHICIIIDNMGTYHTLSSGKICSAPTTPPGPPTYYTPDIPVPCQCSSYVGPHSRQPCRRLLKISYTATTSSL